MSAPVINDFQSVSKRLGKLKIFCLLFSYVAFLPSIFWNFRTHEALAYLAICSALIALLVRFIKNLLAKHADLDILKYEPYFHGLVAIAILIGYVVYSRGLLYYYRLDETFICGFVTYALFAIEAWWSYNLPTQTVETKGLEHP